MLKIPELPIYNTERYTNFSPISPDDIRPGNIYTNDSLFLYVSHFSFNKTAGYSVWDKDGEYISTDIFTSYNIYAIVTYLNNNNFRPLDYDFEVVDPYNTDRRLLLTPHGIKNVNNVDEKYIRKKVSKLVEKVVRQVLKENINGDFGTNDDIVEEMDIDPKNKGKFTATQKRTGKSTEQLCHSKNPLTRKRANFAKMAKRGWKPLNEGIFDMFKKKRNEPTEQNNEQEQNHVYSVKELQSLCDNQLNITPFEWKVLNAALWVRARQANYHGYAKQWSNIMAKDGELYYWDKGKLKRVP